MPESRKVKTDKGFLFDYFNCLRAEYAKNECTLCIDLCPEGAMVFDRKSLTLDPVKCTSCAACMGVCPTEAFGGELFDPERFVIAFAEEEGDALSCRREDLPCLSALSPEHLIAAVLRKESDVVCETGRCGACEVNRTGTVLSRIETIVDEANRFLQKTGSPHRVRPADEVEIKEGAGKGDEVDESRRALFRKVAAPVAEQRSRPDFSDLIVGDEEKQPLKRILLKKSLKKIAEDFPEDTKIDEPFEFVVGKSIDAMACTNCQECAMFCPTGALSTLQDNTGIVFQVGKCIHCAICNEICQPRAIDNVQTFDLVDFAFDRIDLLVKHTLEICEECKIAFPYKGGEKVCDRCKDFRNNYSDLFTMAKDLE